MVIEKKSLKAKKEHKIFIRKKKYKIKGIS